MVGVRKYQGVLVALLLILGPECFAVTRAQERQMFLQIENQLMEGAVRDFTIMAEGLENYPLYPYLEYHWLRKNLKETTQIKVFLQKNKSSRYARKLRYKWLNYLYKHGKWHDFVKYSKASKRKSQQCRYQWARYQLNYKTKALTETQKIWLTGHSLPKACDPLLVKFTDSSLLTQALVWKRFKLAVTERQNKLATFLSKKLKSKQAKKQAKQWLQLVKNTERVGHANFMKNIPSTQQAEMVAYAMKRLISKNIKRALLLWEESKGQYAFTQAQIDKVQRSIALQLAFNKSDKAYAEFQKIKKLDSVTRIWMVRAALIEQNWHHVQVALNQLSMSEKKQERWRYWQARTFLQTNELEKGRAIYSELATERSYYGFIAADYLQQDYLLDNKPIIVEQKRKERLLSTKTFKMIEEFKALELREEAQLNWWDALRGLKEKDVLTAAKIAQQWQWNKLAILTVARVKHWDDVALRFPIDFADKIQENANLQALDQSIIYGLIRRESMFDHKAHSPVGALGLMQVMPRTGQQIAKEIKFPWKSTSILLEAPVNIKFGSYYYKQMLNEFNGHYALAAAAYNAGPHRVVKWLKIKQDYPADIWIETIPFKETRAYVSAVLTYALIYQNQLGKGQLTMADFMLNIRTNKRVETHLVAENN